MGCSIFGAWQSPGCLTISDQRSCHGRWQRGETIRPLAEVNGPGREQDPRPPPARQRDHVLGAAASRATKSVSIPVSTSTRRPWRNTISIRSAPASCIGALAGTQPYPAVCRHHSPAEVRSAVPAAAPAALDEGAEGPQNGEQVGEALPTLPWWDSRGGGKQGRSDRCEQRTVAVTPRGGLQVGRQQRPTTIAVPIFSDQGVGIR